MIFGANAKMKINIDPCVKKSFVISVLIVRNQYENVCECESLWTFWECVSFLNDWECVNFLSVSDFLISCEFEFCSLSEFECASCECVGERENSV